MSRAHYVGRLAALLVVACLSTYAGATSPRTFVASNGVDNPSCSINAPCRGFAAAVAATSANGEVIVLDSAGYGVVTVTKSISIHAPAGVYAGISAIGPGANGIVVNGTNLVVTLRNLVIHGVDQTGQDSGFGIMFVGDGGALYVDHCEISGMAGAGLEIRAGNALVSMMDSVLNDNVRGVEANVGSDGTRIVAERLRVQRSTLPGILLTTATEFVMRDSLIAGGADVGLEIFITGPGTKGRFEIDRSVLTQNAGGGVSVYASGDANTIAEGSISHSLLADNIGYGVLATTNQVSSQAQMKLTLDSNVVRANSASGIGVIIGQPVASGYVLGTRNTIVGNGQYGIVAGFGFVSRGDNTVYGNGAQQVSGSITTISGI